MSSNLLFLTCPPRVVKSLVDEVTMLLEAKQSAARVVKYGVLCKGQDGFVIIAVPYPEGFSSRLLDDIRHDEEITGYVLLPSETVLSVEMEAHDDTR